MDRLHSMRVFARVIEEGSFAGSARELDLSPAIVTRLVADLESHLGARLINRTTRRLVLTETGELYLERVRQILAEIDEADALASASTSEPSGHLRVLCPPSFAVHQLAQLLSEFRVQHPRITLEITAIGIGETLDENHDISLLTLRNDPPAGEFVVRRLALCEVVVCASPQYLARKGYPKHPNELAQHDALLSPRMREITFYRRMPHEGVVEGETVRLSPQRPGLGSTHSDTLRAAALAGMGIVGLPSFVAADALRDGSLVRVLPGWYVATNTLYAAMPTRKYLPARTRALLDFLLLKLGGEAKDPWLAGECHKQQRLP